MVVAASIIVKAMLEIWISKLEMEQGKTVPGESNIVFISIVNIGLFASNQEAQKHVVRRLQVKSPVKVLWSRLRKYQSTIYFKAALVSVKVNVLQVERRNTIGIETTSSRFIPIELPKVVTVSEFVSSGCRKDHPSMTPPEI